jgi:hypothetical protein
LSKSQNQPLKYRNTAKADVQWATKQGLNAFDAAPSETTNNFSTAFAGSYEQELPSDFWRSRVQIQPKQGLK